MGRVLAFASLLLVACDDLSAVQAGVCGNDVVDPGEDCDSHSVGANTYCRPPGTEGQCRYACTVGGMPVCPVGMGCGTDGTCRAASGTFASSGTQPIAGTFSDVLVGDVDGDHRADVVGVEQGDFATTYFDGTLVPTATVQTPRSALSKVHPLLYDLSGDGRDDLLAAASYGTLVNLGSASRTFVPTACPSLDIAGLTEAYLIVLKGLPNKNPGDAGFVMGTFMGLHGIALLQPSGQGAVFALMSQSPSNLAGRVVVGHMQEDPLVSPCDDLAFGYVGGTDVEVYTACVPDGMGGAVWNSYFNTSNVPVKVALPAGATLVRGPMLLDVNGDGHLDFLVSASRCPGCGEVDVAYGVGDGTFHSDPLTLPKSAGNDAFSVYPALPGRGRYVLSDALPLALGDLNGDGVLDHVLPLAVLVSQPGGLFKPAAENHGAPWTEAVIADFNHDGIPDVAAGSDSGNDVSFFYGTSGGLLDPFVISSRPVRHLTVGDFDGDLVDDLALAELASPTDPLGDSVSVMFGNAAGAPTAPISMGRFVSITEIATGRSQDPFGVLPGTNGLLTVSAPDMATSSFGGFPGSGDRVLRSPLLMTSGISNTIQLETGFPLRYALGHFTTKAGPIEVAATAYQVFPVTPSPVHRAWVLSTDGQGRFNTTSIGATGQLDETALDWSHAAMTAVDLDGMGTDRLVVLGPSGIDATKGTAMVANVVMGMNGYVMFNFAPPTMVPAVVSRTEADAAAAQTGRVLAADIDGDGRKDVVAIGSVNGVSSAVVFWNDLGGHLGAMTALPTVDGRPVVDVAMLDTGGATPAVAILTDQNVSLVTAAGRTPSAATKAFDVSQGQVLAQGDVDGDGVPDLVVSTPAGFSVYRQLPVHP